MEIKSVEHRKPDAKALKKGEPTWLTEHFFVVTKEGDEMTVPTDPNNRHYMELRDWYDQQAPKPFKFDFEKVVEAEPTPETEEDGSGITMTAEQTKDAKLPAINLTKEQRTEIATKNK